MSRSNIFARKSLACSHRALGFLASVEIPRLRFVAPLGMTHKRQKSAQTRRGHSRMTRHPRFMIIAVSFAKPLHRPRTVREASPYGSWIAAVFAQKTLCHAGRTLACGFAIPSLRSLRGRQPLRVRTNTQTNALFSQTLKSSLFNRLFASFVVGVGALDVP